MTVCTPWNFSRQITWGNTKIKSFIDFFKSLVLFSGVNIKVMLLSKSFSTSIAMVRFFPFVYKHVSIQGPFSRENAITPLTWMLTSTGNGNRSRWPHFRRILLHLHKNGGLWSFIGSFLIDHSMFFKIILTHLHHLNECKSWHVW